MRIVLFGIALLWYLTPFAAAVPPQDGTQSKIRFEARCEPQSPDKTLLIVNDTCYYLLAKKKEEARLAIDMSDFGIPGMFEIRAVRIDSDEGQAILGHIPSTYNNQLSSKILKVYKK